MSEKLSTAGTTPDNAKMLPQGERNWGFSVHEVEGPHSLHSLEDVLTSAEETKHLVEDSINDGSIKILAPNPKADPNALPADVLPRFVSILVSQEEYDEQVKTGLIPPNENAYGSKVGYFNPAYTAEKGLYKAFPDKFQEVTLREVVRGVEQRLDQSYNIPEDLESLPGLSQCFKISNGYDTAQIYNFSETLLTGEQLHQAINAVREIDERSGGAMMNRLQSISILPETHPDWRKLQDGGEEAAGMTTGRADGNGYVRINEWLLKEGTPHAFKTVPKNPHSIEGDNLEVVLVHELTHVVERYDAQSNPNEQYGAQIGYRIDADTKVNPGPEDAEFKGETPFPFPYGQQDRHEDAAETGSAQFVGGEWVAQIDDLRTFALQAMYARRHSGRHGPAYIQCEEVDLNNLKNKIGSDLPHELTFQLFASLAIRA